MIRHYIIAPIVMCLALLFSIYFVWRILGYIVMFDSDGDGRYEVRFRNYYWVGFGLADTRWWYQRSRPMIQWIADVEIAYRNRVQR